MNDQGKYEEWKTQFYKALQVIAPETAGQTTSDAGGFQHVGFHVGAAYGTVGDDGGMIVAVTLKDGDSFGQGHHSQVTANWRQESPQDVARSAIAKFIHLRQQYL